MNVGELKKHLQKYDDDKLVVMLPHNTHYIENISEVWDGMADLRDKEEEVSVVVLESSRQIGHRPE